MAITEDEGKNTMASTRPRQIVLVVLMAALLLGTAQALPPETYYEANVAYRGYVDDTHYGPFDIGFNFTYFGDVYTEFYATSNGYVGFGPNATYDTYDNACLPTAAVPNCVFAFWDDTVIHADGGVIFYQTIGDAPNRKCIIQFTNMGFWNDPTLLGTFSVILYETSNNVQVQYRILVDPRSARAHGNSATIGLNNLAGDTAAEYSCNTESIESEMALLFTPGGGTYGIDDTALYFGALLGDELPPTIPELVTPAEGSTICLQPTFRWTAASNVESYTFRISTSSDLSGSTDTDVGTATNYTAPDPLVHGTTYYWAVFANGNGQITWSEIHSFTADANAPPVASPQTVWTTLGAETVITLDGVSCGAPQTATITALPLNGSLYQYIDGALGDEIVAVPTAVEDDENRVIFFVNDGTIGTDRGNFDFTITANAVESGDATVTINIYPAPTVTSAEVTGLDRSTADCGGNVLADNGFAVTARGVCWNTTGWPTTADSKTTDGAGEGAFASRLTGLTPGTTYYARAYATNSEGSGYGNQREFTTLFSRPHVSTGTPAEIGPRSARCPGEVTFTGDGPVTARGVCLGTQPNPTIDHGVFECGSGTGTFEAHLTGLSPVTTYYVRAFATNDGGTAYGEGRTFVTDLSTPNVFTTRVTGVTTDGFSMEGDVTFDGGGDVDARGACWSTSTEPTIAGDHTAAGAGTGTFSVQVTGLEPGQLYYVRAFATNSAGTYYGSQLSVTTGITAPTVSTTPVTDIGYTSATAGGHLVHTGGETVSACGVCWSTSSPPTQDDAHLSVEAAETFSCAISELLPGTRYYVRAYAVNAAGTSYGEPVAFTTVRALPSVVTSPITPVSPHAATGGGQVTDGGDSAVTARGVCWSAEGIPDLEDSHTVDGEGDGSYSSTLEGLALDTTYRARAYATNARGTAYGEVVIFTTTAGTAQVATANPQVIGPDRIAIGGDVTGDGGLPVTERGVCWNTSGDPTIQDARVKSGSGRGPFYAELGGIEPEVTYHLRAYAINESGASYGQVLTIQTEIGLPTVGPLTIASITSAGASAWVDLIRDGGAPVEQSGVCWSTSPRPTPSDPHVAAMLRAGKLTATLDGLRPNTLYYARAFATNRKGTTYGDVTHFRTAIGLPEVLSTGVNSIDADAATIAGVVVSTGGTTELVRGVCWSTSNAPSLNESHLEVPGSDGAFTARVTGLMPGQAYVMRCYATNAAGTAYGQELIVRTPVTLTEVTTARVTTITSSTAEAGGTVVRDGGGKVLSRGVCWNTRGTPTVDDDHALQDRGAGSFVSRLEGLRPGTRYHLRAFATNPAGITYGQTVMFTTLVALPSLGAADVAAVTATSALVRAQLLADGGGRLSRCGLCWGTTNPPTIDDAHVQAEISGGELAANLDGLSACTTYFVRAFAENGAGIAYGEARGFTTSGASPAVLTDEVTGVGAQAAQGAGMVLDAGGGTISSCGLCWNETGRPTLADPHVTLPGPYETLPDPHDGFSMAIEPLEPGRTYHVRAFAVNRYGTGYGNEIVFATECMPPLVVALTYGELSSSSVRIQAEVQSDGGAPVLTRGFCWSLESEPTVDRDAKVAGAGSGAFAALLENLEPNRTYHIRAYAENSAGIAYSEELILTTAVGLPILGECVAVSRSARSAWMEVAVLATGGDEISACGLCWSQSPGPTLEDAHQLAEGTSGTQSCLITDLIPGVTYYVRPFATNSAGTAYGEETEFSCWDTRLSGVNPNPSGGSVSLSYTLTQPGEARFEVFDLTGRLVREWRHDRAAAGLNSTAWDGRTQNGERAGSGIYYIRLAGPDGQDTRGVVMLR